MGDVRGEEKTGNERGENGCCAHDGAEAVNAGDSGAWRADGPCEGAAARARRGGRCDAAGGDRGAGWVGGDGSSGSESSSA